MQLKGARSAAERDIRKPRRRFLTKTALWPAAFRRHRAKRTGGCEGRAASAVVQTQFIREKKRKTGRRALSSCRWLHPTAAVQGVTSGGEQARVWHNGIAVKDFSHLAGRTVLGCLLTLLALVACDGAHPRTSDIASGDSPSGNGGGGGRGSATGGRGGDPGSGASGADGSGASGADGSGASGADGSGASGADGSATSICSAGRVSVPPADLVARWGLSPFYEQHLDFRGLPLLSSVRVEPEALAVACEIVEQMLRKRPEILTQLIEHRVRVAIMAEGEVTTDIPEHADLNEVFPGTDWDTGARGLGATLQRPASTVGEENLLRLPGDRYQGESIMVHEFAHTMWELGVLYLPDGPEQGQALAAAYHQATQAGLWADTYATTNTAEYWAEAAQSWFNANLQAEPPNGVHNHVNTREELRDYDPAVGALAGSVFLDDAWVVP